MILNLSKAGEKMHNILIKKVWEDVGFIEVKIEAVCDYVSAWQNCYIQDEDLLMFSYKLEEYGSTNEKTYLEFGSKEGNSTPAFSLDIMEPDSYGHVLIEVDMEIDDNDSRKHRCCFYVQTEIGCVERFGTQLRSIINRGEFPEAVLHPYS